MPPAVRLVEVLGPLVPESRSTGAMRSFRMPRSARIPVQADAAGWVLGALALAGTGGRVVAIDYARSTTAVFAQRPQRVAAHLRRPRPRRKPCADPGSADITCDIAVDQLGLVASPAATVRTRRAAFLRQHGIDELVAEGAAGDELGLSGGLAAIEARSRVSEAAALLDPDGLGGFTVVEWLP
ncbi:MAG: hypothetical protein R2701_03210 [Acidimicrobiales bacterium]